MHCIYTFTIYTSPLASVPLNDTSASTITYEILNGASILKGFERLRQGVISLYERAFGIKSLG